MLIESLERHIHLIYIHTFLKLTESVRKTLIIYFYEYIQAQPTQILL